MTAICHLLRGSWGPLLILVYLLALQAGPAKAALPEDMARNIAAMAAAANNSMHALSNQTRADQNRANLNRHAGYQSLDWIKARRTRDSGNSALGSVVVSSISARPDLVAEIIAAAVSAAPASARAVARQTAHVFPGFSPLIARASGLPLSQISSSAWTEYRASPDHQRLPVVAVAPATTMPPPSVYRPVYTVAKPTLPSPRPTPPADGKRVIAEDQKIAPGFHGKEEMSDPIEGINRAVFAFNDAIDVMFLRPIAALYGYLMPLPAKPAAQRFFKNLSAPVVMVNDLVQLDGKDAAVTAGRFVINSTVGVLGLFDVAKDMDMPGHRADFGQSLHSYGVGPGPYLVLPLFGPANLRDTAGRVVDGFLDPFSYLLKANLRTGRDVGSALVGRESLIPALHNLRNKSVDYYAALRAASYQNRVLGLNKGRAGLANTSSQQTDDMFDQAE